MLPLILITLLAAPQDARRWAEALANWGRYSGSRDSGERARAAQEIGNATYDKHDRQAWLLLGALLRQELAKEGQGGKNEEKVAGDVVEACLGSLRKITNKDAVAEMLKAARNKNESVRVRMYLIWALSAQGPIKDLLELADDKIPHVQIAAIDSLALRGDKAALELFLRVQKEETRPWEAKWAALEGIEKVADEACVEPMIEGLGACRAEEGRLKDLYLRILKKLVGAEVPSDDPNAWKAAWAAKKEGKEPGNPAEGGTVAEPTEFYGLKTRSTRIVFVLDRTGSMEAAGSEPPRTIFDLPPSLRDASKEHPVETAARNEATKIKKKHDDRPVVTRMDVAKKEFINTVYILSPKVQFNVIWYEGNPTPWKQELVPATWQNKLDCIKDADRLNPSGPTNIWDALEVGFRMTEVPQKRGLVQIDKKANYATAINGADTFFLMTDGVPNVGRIAKPLEILAEIRKVNRLRKIAIHTICVGEPAPPGMPVDALLADPPDPDFLKQIADENGGAFVHILKKK